jgi:hypothetical protein
MHVAGRLAWLGRVGVCVLLCYFPAPALAQSPQPSVVEGAQRGVPEARATGASDGLPNRAPPGSVSGVIVDPSESIVAGAQVRLTREDQSPSEEVLTDANGRFSFVIVSSGSFQLTITLEGFTMPLASRRNPCRTRCLGLAQLSAFVFDALTLVAG